MRIERVNENKKRYLDLLLLADEQESMIDRYLEDGDMFALFDDDLRTVCVVTRIDHETCELKNLATYPAYQKRGYGMIMIEYVCDQYRGTCTTMVVGTGEVPSILSFYRKCGFERSHVVKDFFVDNYDHIMVEEGVQLVDMVYLRRRL